MSTFSLQIYSQASFTEHPVRVYLHQEKAELCDNILGFRGIAASPREHFHYEPGLFCSKPHSLTRDVIVDGYGHIMPQEQVSRVEASQIQTHERRCQRLPGRLLLQYCQEYLAPKRRLSGLLGMRLAN